MTTRATIKYLALLAQAVRMDEIESCPIVIFDREHVLFLAKNKPLPPYEEHLIGCDLSLTANALRERIAKMDASGTPKRRRRSKVAT